MRQKNSDSVDGGLSGGSHVRGHRSEDPHLLISFYSRKILSLPKAEDVGVEGVCITEHFIPNIPPELLSFQMSRRTLTPSSALLLSNSPTLERVQSGSSSPLSRLMLVGLTTVFCCSNCQGLQVYGQSLNLPMVSGVLK